MYGVIDFYRAAKEAGIKQPELKHAMDLAVAKAVEHLVAGEAVTIEGLGVLSPVEVKERPGRNVKTGEEIVIPAHKKLTLKVSRTTKEIIKNS